MADIKYGVKAIVGAILGILITVFGWYLFSAFADLMPTTELKVMYWIGVLLYWFSAVLILPMMMILSKKGDFKGAIYGLFAFIGGYMLSLLLYYVGAPILEALNSIFPNSTFNSILWFGIYTMWLLGLVIAPTALTLKDVIK